MRISLLVPGMVLACLLVVAGGLGADPAEPAARPQATALPRLEPQSEQLARMERRVFERINRARRQQGRAPLRWDPALAGLARDYSRRRSAEGFTGHVDPAGRGLEQRLQQAGMGYRLAGENLARNYNVPRPSAAAVDGWLASEDHRRNLLSAGYSESAVGVWREGETFHFTQIFRAPPR